MFGMDFKLFAKDFVDGKLPKKVGEIKKCNQFGGCKVEVIEIWGNAVLVKMV